ncbi:hypothetical protein ACFVYA_35930 [Amycolatopsis sp. NPDC058278]|uniref:hypothetical protein n=1 Tax=Amycolatopsis sp. NPDC058278 TaxID=3346417 RepID=UPI0036DA394F
MTVRMMHRPPLTAKSPDARARPRNRWAPTAWIGLDLVMALGCATTACLFHRGDARARLSASAVAALMAMDAWFDVLTAQAGTEFTQALVCAVPELALVGLCAYLSLHNTERLS